MKPARCPAGRLVVALMVLVVTTACLQSYASSPTPPERLTCLEWGAGTAMTWYSPSLASDNTQLEKWCVTLGPPELDSIPAGTFGDLGTSDSLAIAVWNTDAGAGYLMEFIAKELGLDCSADNPRLRAGSSHFVLLVQEALRRSNEIPDIPKQWETPPPVKENDHPGSRLGVVQVAKECGLAYIYLPAARNGWEARDGEREDKGNAILSTLPLSDFIGIELPFESARRVVPAATVHATRGDSLRIASVHLITTPQAWRVLVTGNSARERQSLGVVAALDEIEADRSGAESPDAVSPDSVRYGISTVIAGDLNTWSTREVSLRRLLVYFPDSPPVMQEGTRGPFPTDHLLFRAREASSDTIIPGSYRRIDDPYYSDHNPIIAWFRFGR